MAGEPVDGDGDGRVFLARHGQTVLNAEGRLRGLADPPLDEQGRAEVAALAVALASFGPRRVLSSPLQRAVATAEAIGQRCGIPVEVEPRLTDRDYGEWTGSRRDEVIGLFGSVDAAPGVEDGEEVTRRVREVLDEQLAHLVDGPVVLVAHDATNSRLLSALYPDHPDPETIGQRTACWNELRRQGDRWTVVAADRRP